MDEAVLSDEDSEDDEEDDDYDLKDSFVDSQHHSCDGNFLINIFLKLFYNSIKLYIMIYLRSLFKYFLS